MSFIQKARDLLSNFQSKASNAGTYFNQGLSNIKKTPWTEFTPFSMKSRAVGSAMGTGELIRRTLNTNPQKTYQTAQDIGYGVRGALNLTPFQAKPLIGAGPAINNRQLRREQTTAPTTFRQQTAQSIGQGIYGGLLTSPLAGGIPGMVKNAVIGTGLGVGMGVSGDVLGGRGLPNKQQLMEHALGGFQNSWILPITNTFTDKVLSKFAPQLVGRAITAPFKSGEIKKGLIQVFSRALAEVPAENTAFTWLSRLDNKSKESFMQDWINQLPGSILTNVAFAGVQGTWNTAINKQSREAVSNALQNTIRRWNMPVSTMEFDKNGRRVTVPMWQYKAKIGMTTKNINELSPKDYAKAQKEMGEGAMVKGGRVVGAPQNMTSMAQLKKFRNVLTANAVAGKEGKNWYKNAGNTILELFQGDKEKATKFSQLLAIYSGRTSIDANMTNALKAWYQYDTGQPIKAGTFGWQDRAASNLLNSNVPWGGRKTNSFYKNIVKSFNPEEGGGEVTIDRWMMRALGYKTDNPSPQQYQFAEREITRLSNKLGWDPEQTQAALWINTLAGKSKSPKSSTNFVDAAKKNYGQLSWEADPGKSGGLFPEMHNAPMEQKLEYHKAIDSIFYDKKGNDLVAQLLGIPMGKKLEAPGVFQGETNPGTQFMIPMPRGHKVQGAIEPSAKKVLDVYAAIRGKYASQDAVAYHKPFYGGKISGDNGVEILLGKTITMDEAKALDAAIIKNSGTADLSPISSPEGARILNFTNLKNTDVHDIIAKSVAEVFPNKKEVPLRTFVSDGNYISNDWKTNSHGEDYNKTISAYSEDLLGRSDTLFATKAEGVHSTFKQKYGWTDGRKGTLTGGKSFATKAVETVAAIQPGLTTKKITEAEHRAKMASSEYRAELQPKVTTEGKKISPTHQEVIELLGEAKPMRAQQEELYNVARSAQSGALNAMGRKYKGEAGFYKKLGTLKGELPRVEFERIRNGLKQKKIDSLFNEVEGSKLRPFEKITAGHGLAKLFGAEGGQIPTESEMKLLNEIFPKELTDAIMAKRPFTSRLFGEIAGALNVPRSVMSSFDLSAPLRQGAFLIGRPKQWIPAFVSMFKYAGSEKAYQGLMDEMPKRKYAKEMEEAGLATTDLGANLNNREESIMSNLPEKIPVLGRMFRGSNRAYTGFLVKLRADVFEDLIDSAKRQGLEVKGKRLQDIADFVNSATGRGKLSGNWSKMAPALNGIFFSPRLIKSRVDMLNPMTYVNYDPFVRKEALKSLVGFAGTALTVMALAKMGGADVGDDPRSADFGKIKVGNTRYDILGGFGQYIKLASQLITGQIVSTTTGKIMTVGEGYKPLTRKDILLRFFEGKSSPVASLVIALASGQTAVGEPVNVPTEVLNRFIPMIISDIYDVARDRDSASLGITMGVPGLFGTGLQTYGGTEVVKGKNQIGQTTSQIKPVKGLAEEISTKVFGEQTLGSTSSWNAEAYYDQLLKMPIEERRKQWETIKTNPDLVKKIADVISNRNKGITVEDLTLKGKGVASGDRAMAVYKEFMKLKTPEEKRKLWAAYVKKGILTADVIKQLNILLQK